MSAFLNSHSFWSISQSYFDSGFFNHVRSPNNSDAYFDIAPKHWTFLASNPYQNLIEQNGLSHLAFDLYESFYPAVIMSKNSFEAGLLLAEAEETTQFWNFTDAPITITNIVYNQFSGITTNIDDYGELPITIGTNETIDITFYVSLEGSSNILATATYYFSTGDVRTFTIIGQRLIVLPYEPKGKYIDRYEWKTTVTRTKNGNEYFQTLRNKPKHTMFYSFPFADDVQGQKLLNTLSFAATSKYGVPLWQEPSPLNAELLVGATTIMVDTTISSFEVGGGFVIINGNDYWAGSISAVAADQITTQFPMAKVPPLEDSIVYPVMQAFVSQRQKVANYSSSYREFDLNFEITKDVTIGEDKNAIYGTNLNGYPVMQEPIEFTGKTAQETFESFASEVDFGIALEKKLYKQRDQSQRKFTYFKTLKGLDEIYRMREWLFWLKGKAGAFYAPESGKQFTPVFDIDSGENLITIEPTYFENWFASKVLDAYVWVDLPDQSYITQIISVGKSEDLQYSEIQFAQAFTGVYAKEDIKIKLLTLVRPDTDQMDIKFERASQASIAFKCNEVWQ